MRFNWRQVEETWWNTYTKLEHDTTKFDIIFRLGRFSRKIFVWLLLGPYDRALGYLGLRVAYTIMVVMTFDPASSVV